MAKDGAEGVFAAALPDGRAAAVKIADGAIARAAPVLAAALARGRVSTSTRRSSASRSAATASRSARCRPLVGERRVTEPDVPHARRRRVRPGRPGRPLIRRVIAENPSKFTYRGTGTYIVGHGEVVVIDPGPRLDSHRDALAAALARRAGAGDPRHPLPQRPLAARRVAARRDRRADVRASGRTRRPIRRGRSSPGRPDDRPRRRVTIDEPVEIEESTDFAFAPASRVADGDVVADRPG